MRKAFYLALLFGSSAALAASTAPGCATGVETGTGGSGGSGPSSTGTGASTASSTATSTSTGTSGACVYASDCPPTGDPCTEPSCINNECKTKPANELGACDDGNWCTDNDVCKEGVCTGGTTKYCPPPDTCHIGVCDPVNKNCGVAPGNDGAQCDDGDPCTGWGTCSNGSCQLGAPIDCSFLDGTCADGVCDPQLGCIQQPKNDGAPCDDGFFCTINDTCTSGICNGEPNTCTAPGDVCMIGACDEVQKKCTAVPGNNGGACDDGNDCTAGETCSNGKCMGGLPANDGMPCDDKDGCTQGTTCANGTCANPTSSINQCVGGDACCPANCAIGQDPDCLYWATGVQQNVPEASLVGWSLCYNGNYADSPSVSGILSACSKSKLLMACRKSGQPSFALLAMGPRLDVLFDCGSQTNCTKQSNGVGWYFSGDWSWGFAPGGEPVYRFTCDYNGNGPQTFPELRMCWHTGGGNLNFGYRCGDDSSNFPDQNWERRVYHAD